MKKIEEKFEENWRKLKKIAVNLKKTEENIEENRRKLKGKLKKVEEIWRKQRVKQRFVMEVKVKEILTHTLIEDEKSGNNAPTCFYNPYIPAILTSRVLQPK